MTGRPALATAEVGIAIGAGTDVAIETADVVLMHSDSLDVLVGLRVGKGSVRKTWQNLGWAVEYDAIAQPIAAGVLVPAHGRVVRPDRGPFPVRVAVIVAVNALLLKRLKLPAATSVASTGAREPASAMHSRDPML